MTLRDETIALHHGYEPDRTRAVAVPIYQTVAHDFIDAEHAAAVFDLQVPGYHYNRVVSPTNEVLERRLAALEHGTEAVTVASGAAAVSLALTMLASAGCSFVATPELYGATYTFLAHILPSQGVAVRFAADDRPETVAALIDETTRAVFCESIGNPAGSVVDIEALAQACHDRCVPLIVDNTVATPLMLKPIDHGADVVVHSLTKFIGGHGVAIGGAIIDAGSFPWDRWPERYPMLNEPEPTFHGVVYTRDHPVAPFVTRCRTVGLRNLGATLAPLNAFLILQGLETLGVRLERHEQNGRAVAEFLRDDPRVAWVRYHGFPEHPFYEAAQRYLGGRAPSILTFGASGGYEASLRVFDALRLFKRLVNLGDAKSLVAHPASTTHRQLGPSELASAGVTPDMLRLSVGIEHIDDILDDLDQALAAANGV